MEIRLADAGVRFGEVVALDGATLSIPKGEQVALVGPSGSGKTTLLRLIGGGVRPTSGEVVVDQRPLTDHTPAELRRLRARLGYVPQHLALVPNLRVIQNVASGRLGGRSLLHGLRAVAWSTRAEAAEIHALLERVGIPEKLYARTDTLSGGQQQRVAIARALYQEPVVLLADEPVSAVDPARARDAVALLCDTARELGVSLVVSLHNLKLAREFFGRLIGLRAGRVAFDRQTGDIDDAEFDELYKLTRDELLADGAAR